MPISDLQFPYGAVYFRKSNPPQEHWERDYAVAAEDGLNIFRHWFMWGAIETAPGVYDWEEYDRQLDLAAKNGLKTVIAELIHAVPDWAVRKFSHALHQCGWNQARLLHGRLGGHGRLLQQWRRGGRADVELPRSEGGGRCVSHRACHPLQGSSRHLWL